MQFEINRKEFISALSVGGSMAGKVKSIPILDDVKITIKGTSAVISSFDNETAVTKRTSIKSSSEDSMFCINPRILVNLLKTIKDDVVTLCVAEKVCTVIHSKGEATLPVEPAIDFPSPVKEDDAQVVTLPCEALFEWFKRAKCFVDNSEKAELRPVLKGVYFYVERGEVGVASTDNSKFFHDNKRVDGLEEVKVGVVITPKSIDAILDAINGNETVSVSFGKKNIVFKVADAMVSSRLIEGAYPKFKKIFEREFPNEVVVNRSDLYESVVRASLSANAASSLLKLTIEPSGKIMIDSEDLFAQRKTHEEVLCEVQGEFLEIGFKGTSLTECLNTMDGEMVIIKLNDYKSPAMFKESDGSAKAAICMPLLIPSIANK